MGSCHQCQAVVVVKGLTNVLAKSVAGTSWAYSPSASVVGVTPKQVAHGAFMGHLLDSVKSADVVKGINTRRETTVETEDLVVNEGCEGEVVEEVGKVLPDIGVAVFAQAFVVEAVDLGDLARLVIATEDGDALGVADLERDEQSDSLDREVASINVIACGECQMSDTRSTRGRHMLYVVENGN